MNTHRNRRRQSTAKSVSCRLGIERLEPRCVLSVVINELMFHPTSGDPGDEYIELFNPGPGAVDLTGWKFNNGVDFTFTGGTLGAGQYLVVAADLAEFQANYPAVSNVVGGWTGQLSNAGETITLVDAADAVVDSVTYADQGDWAFREPGRGRDLVQSITRSGTTATVTVVDHGYHDGDTIVISGADQPEYNGTFTVSGVTNTTPTTFNITISGSPATPATGFIVSRRLTDYGHAGWSWTQLADGLGSSLELVNPALPNEYGQNWSSSTVRFGTPGAANSTADADIAPLVLDLEHLPIIPKSTESVTVMARLVDELGTASAATLYFRADSLTPPPFTAVTMHDDGTSGDAAAGDGVWSAVIPPHANDTVVEFYVSVTDGVNTRTWPGPTDTLGTQGANALYQVDDTTYDGTQPLMKLIMREAERAELAVIGSDTPSLEENSDAEMNGTFIFVDSTGIDARYTVGIRNRGAGSRDQYPNNYRVNLNTDRPWKSTDDVNLNGRFSSEDILGHAIFLSAGMPAEFVVPVQVRVNNANTAVSQYDMVGSYSYLESEGDEYVKEHYPLDDGGNYYRGITAARKSDFKYYGTNPDSYRPYYTKETNVEADDWTDLISLAAAFDATQTPDPVFVATLEQSIDIDQWLRFFAVSALLGNEETSLATGRGDDFVMYRGTLDARFQLIAHDLDTILGRGDEVGDLNASIFRAANDTVNLPSIARFLKFPDIAPRYYAALLAQIDTTFAPANVDALIANVLGGHVNEAIRAEMKSWIAGRVSAALLQIPQAATATSTLPVQNGYPRTTSSTANLTGFSHAAQTRTVLVNGVVATWSAWEAKWTAGNVALRPGINRVLVQSLNENGVEFDRTYIDIWRDVTPVSVSGTLPAGTTQWTAANAYRVTGNLTVPAGSTLIIDPGVTVFFNASVGLTVNGRLQAEGTDLARIRFTRYPSVSGSWQHITIQNTQEDNRIAYADIQYAGSASRNVVLNTARADLDQVVWMNTNARLLDATSSSFRLTNSVTPNTTDVEAIHAGGTFPAAGYALFQGNTFGKVTGGNDVIDFTGGQRPGPIVQILDNVFTGSEDDLLDLDGTDAHIEGNVFMGAHLLDPEDADTSSAISGGISGGNTSEWTIVRNFFYDLDHVVLAKEGAFATLVNNTIVSVSVAAINFDEPLRPGIVPGAGAYLDGNIIWLAPLVFENVDSDGTTTDITVNRSILSTATVYPGAGNSNLDPQLVNTTAVVDPATELRLRPGPGPAVGNGPNGRDMGADVPAGASISGEPASTTWHTDATLLVGGPDIYAYKYRVNGGAWSGEVAVTNPGTAAASVTPITLTGLTDGGYTVEVIAKNSAGVWQDEADATVSQTWTVNTALAPRVWLSEVLASNINTLPVNNSRPDLIELYNDGASSVDLAGMAISDTAGERRFTFTAGTTIAAGGRLVLYGSDADSPPGIKLNFALSQTGEGVYLYDTLANGGGLLDSVVFGRQLTDRSIARRDDGTWGLASPTFGAANELLPLGDPHLVQINEWFTDGSGPDFVELFNPRSLPVDIGGLHLTDDPITQPAQHQIAPLYFVAEDGLAVFIADGEPADGPDHVNFRLGYEHGHIGLFDEAVAPIDRIVYGWQQTGASQGRSPNGDPLFATFTVPNPNIANPAPSTPVEQSLIAVTDVWKYNQSGDQGAAWREASYNDAAWPSGAGLLYVEPSSLPAPKSTALTLGQNTYYFRKHFTLTADPETVLLTLNTVIDDGAVVFINGHEVMRLGMADPPTAVAFATFANRSVDNAVFEGPFGLMTSYLVEGDNVIAVEVHQASSSGSDIVFGLTLDATIVPPPEPAASPLRITEIHYHPANHPLVTDDEDLEFIELLNTGLVAVDLAGVQITQFATTPYTFASGLSLEPGERIVVARDPAVFQSIYGTGINLAPGGYEPANLSNGGERIALLDELGRTIQDFTYGDANVVGWPDSPDGGGPSLEYIGPLDAGEDPNDISPADPFDDPVNWRASLILGGSPGSDGNTPEPLPGDYDLSNTVDEADFTKWRSQYGMSFTPGTESDGNGDGVVNGADYTVWRDNLGATQPGSGSGSGSGSFVASTSDDEMPPAAMVVEVMPANVELPIPVQLPSLAGGVVDAGIVPAIKSLSQNRRGLAHFAESSEQNVPVPLRLLHESSRKVGRVPASVDAAFGSSTSWWRWHRAFQVDDDDMPANAELREGAFEGDIPSCAHLWNDEHLLAGIGRRRHG